MEIHTEITLVSSKGTDFLFSQLIEFCNTQANWHFDEDKSNFYSRNITSKGIVIIFEKAFGVAFYEKKTGRLVKANIAPKQDTLSVHEYNLIAKSFCDAITLWNKKQKNGIKVEITKTDLELEDIITADIPRKLFNKFLSHFPLSYHSLDINRFDRFILSVSRYSRKPVNLHYLSLLLLEKYDWKQSDVEFYINRAEIGLEILQKYKKGI